jgi:hypothetical protein
MTAGHEPVKGTQPARTDISHDGAVTPAHRYAEYWAYVRHIESIRFQAGTILSVVAGGLLAVVWRDHAVLGGLERWTLFLLLVFVLVVEGFLVVQKRSYDRYVDALKELGGPLPRPSRLEPFLWLLLLLVLVETAAIGSFWVQKGVAWSWRCVATSVGVVGQLGIGAYYGCLWLLQRETVRQENPRRGSWRPECWRRLAKKRVDER